MHYFKNNKRIKNVGKTLKAFILPCGTFKKLPLTVQL